MRVNNTCKHATKMDANHMHLKQQHTKIRMQNKHIYKMNMNPMFCQGSNERKRHES